MATSDSYGQARVFVRDQGGSTGYVKNGVIAASGATALLEAGGTIRAAANSTINVDGNLNLTSGTITMPGSLAKGYFDLGPHLFNARQLDASGELVASGSSTPTAFWGGLLMPDGTPSLNTFSTAELVMRINWASNSVVPIALPPIMLPADLATAGGLTLELNGETRDTASAADAIQAITIAARFVSLTSASDPSVGSTHPNFTSTPSWKGITIASGSVAATQILSVRLTPQAHASRGINLYGARGSYTKLTS